VEIIYLRTIKSIRYGAVFIGLLFVFTGIYTLVKIENSFYTYFTYLFIGFAFILISGSGTFKKNRYVKITSDKIIIKQNILANPYEIWINQIKELRIIVSRTAIKTKDSNQFIINLDWVSYNSKKELIEALKKVCDKYGIKFELIGLQELYTTKK
jgi:hypothetical protein